MPSSHLMLRAGGGGRAWLERRAIFVRTVRTNREPARNRPSKPLLVFILLFVFCIRRVFSRPSAPLTAPEEVLTKPCGKFLFFAPLALPTNRLLFPKMR